MPCPTKENSYTATEFASVLGISVTLFAYLKRTHPDFPLPVARTARGFAFDKADAESFAAQWKAETAKRESLLREKLAGAK